MAAANPAGPPAYGPFQGPSNPDGTSIVDTVDGMPVTMPAFSSAFGALAPAAINPLSVIDTAGVPSQNAILIELRCITNLLLLQFGNQVPDIEQMRADELFNTMIVPGGGTI